MTRATKTILKGITLRGSVYQARLTIPKDVRDSLGLVEFTQSLETSDLRVAKTRGDECIRDWKRQITEARGTLSPISEALLWKADYDKSHEEDISLNTSDYRNYSPIDEVLSDKLEHLEASDGYKAAKSFNDIVTGKSLPSDTFVNDYMATRKVVPRSLGQERTRITYGTTAFPTFPVEKQEVNRWALSLIQKPTVTTGMPYSRDTALSIVNTVAKYYQFLLDMGHLNPNLSNAFKDASISTGGGKKESNRTKRVPWNRHQVNHLIEECTKKSDRELLGITLLATHTGARIEELATLEVSSIHLTAAIPYFRITKSKSEAGLRDVPIHPYIHPLLEDMVTRSTNRYLFSNLTVTGHNERSSAISKRFGRLKTKLGYGPHQVFHSFRHTAITMLEQAGVPLNIVMDIVGHGKPNLTFGRYSGGTSMEQRYEAICNSIDFPFHNIPASSLWKAAA